MNVNNYNGDRMAIEEYNLSKISVFFGFVLVLIYWLVLSSFINSMMNATQIKIEPTATEKSLIE